MIVNKSYVLPVSFITSFDVCRKTFYFSAVLLLADFNLGDVLLVGPQNVEEA